MSLTYFTYLCPLGLLGGAESLPGAGGLLHAGGDHGVGIGLALLADGGTDKVVVSVWLAVALGGNLSWGLAFGG